MPREPSDDELVKTLIALTRGQHEWLRRRAFDGRTSIAAEIRALVAKAMGVEGVTTRKDPEAAQPGTRGEVVR